MSKEDFERILQAYLDLYFVKGMKWTQQLQLKQSSQELSDYYSLVLHHICLPNIACQKRISTMPKIKKTNKPFWPCGGDTGLGCGRECWGDGIPQLIPIKLPKHRKRQVIFHSKCAKEVKNNLHK